MEGSSFYVLRLNSFRNRGQKLKLFGCLLLWFPTSLSPRGRCLTIRAKPACAIRTEQATFVHSSVGGRFRHVATPSETQEWIKSGFREHPAMINCSSQRNKSTSQIPFSCWGRGWGKQQIHLALPCVQAAWHPLVPALLQIIQSSKNKGPAYVSQVLTLNKIEELKSHHKEFSGNWILTYWKTSFFSSMGGRDGRVL